MLRELPKQPILEVLDALRMISGYGMKTSWGRAQVIALILFVNVVTGFASPPNNKLPKIYICY